MANFLNGNEGSEKLKRFLRNNYIFGEEFLRSWKRFRQRERERERERGGGGNRRPGRLKKT